MKGYFRFVTDQDPCVAPTDVSDAEQMWIVQKAAEIYRATGCTWLGARIEAETQFLEDRLADRPA